MRIFNFFSPVLDIFFPRVCCYCSRILSSHGRGLCTSCTSCITIHTTFFCIVCGARTVSGIPACHPHTPFFFTAATDYADPRIRALVADLKFHHIADAAIPLAHCLSITLSSLDITAQNTVIVPMPLGRHRQMERGYNQCELIANHLSDLTGISIISTLLLRTHDTAAQSLLSGTARQKNVSDCFALSSFDISEMHGKTIILLDDVVTTGATITSAAKTLSLAHPRRIIAVAAGRA